MVYITDRIILNDKELNEEFICSSGPGGQNVNKVATAVQLRFNIKKSPSIPEDLKYLIIKRLSGSLTESGEIIIKSRKHRTQGGNRLDAVRRLTETIRKAAEKTKPRKKSRPTADSIKQRLEKKSKRSFIKKNRSRVNLDD